MGSDNKPFKNILTLFGEYSYYRPYDENNFPLYIITYIY